MVFGLACLVLHGWVKNQVVWGLACLVTYVLVNSYNIVVFSFCFYFIYNLSEIVQGVALVCPEVGLSGRFDPLFSTIQIQSGVLITSTWFP